MSFLCSNELTLISAFAFEQPKFVGQNFFTQNKTKPPNIHPGIASSSLVIAK
jgi:hypothetical protein